MKKLIPLAVACSIIAVSPIPGVTQKAYAVSTYDVKEVPTVPPQYMPIYKAAGAKYGIPWNVLAAIHYVETTFGTDLSVSSAGAIGQMQFMPDTWQQYAVDGDGDGKKDPNNVADAVFSAANNLADNYRNNNNDLRKAIWDYNHADWYVNKVLRYAELFTGQPNSMNGLNHSDIQMQQIQSQVNQLEQQQQQNSQIIQQQISDLKGQQQGVQQQVSMIDLQLEQSTQKLTSLQKQIQDATKAKNIYDKKFTVAKNDWEKYKKVANGRIAAMYEIRPVDYLDVLMSSESFGDMITRLEDIQTIVNQDQTILADYEKVAKKFQYSKLIEDGYSMQLSQMKSSELQAQNDLQLQKKQRQQLLANIKTREGQLVDDLTNQQTAVQNQILQLQGGYSYGNGPSVSSGWIWPSDSHEITSPFGTRVHPVTHVVKRHTGIDIGNPEGAPIYSAAAGKVAYAGYMDGYGNTVVVDHGNGTTSLYAHIQNGGILVQQGQTVQAHQKIAEVGATGVTTGPHLHFEIRFNGTPVDPLQYVK